ncbi:MAG: hypothetical protein KQH63_15160 [Desulfobulbaceae bacterium]|nr:hypothetical protein [Desulfobulbaceae bacterium]
MANKKYSIKIDGLAKSSQADHPPTQYQQVTYLSAAVEGVFTKPSKLKLPNSTKEKNFLENFPLFSNKTKPESFTVFVLCPILCSVINEHAVVSLINSHLIFSMQGKILLFTIRPPYIMNITWGGNV